MKKLLLTLMFLICSTTVFAGVENELDRIKGHMPGCAVGIVNQSELFFERYRGYASLRYDIPISETTIFNVGSISKHMTAAVFFRLEKKGVFNRTDSLIKYYPNGPEWYGKVTLDHLLSNRSGIPDYLNDEEFASELLNILSSDFEKFSSLFMGLPISHEDVVAIVQEGMINLDGPMFEPGLKFSYSNTGFLLLADIINKHTDHSLSYWADRFIFKPYGMENTSINDEMTTELKWYATGYMSSPYKKKSYKSLIDLIASQGEAGVLTTLRDFSKWIEVLNNSVSPDSDWYGFLTNLLEDDVLSSDYSWYQNGLEIKNRNGLNYSHGGFSMDGQVSIFWISPEQQVGYMRFCNFEYQWGVDEEDVFEYLTDHGMLDLID